MKREILFKNCWNSATKKLIFRVGIDAGFFSEYNNMIFTIHYCLVNNIKFILNSNGANFSFSKGWQDYFLPFTYDCNSELNRLYNNRSIPPLMIRQRDKLGFALFMFWLLIRKINFVTWQILPEAQKQKVDGIYEIPELGLQGTLLENCRQLSQIVWRYQPEIKVEIDKIKSSVIISLPYIGFHLRRGDKKKETRLISVDKYLEKAEKLSSIRTAFVATDDYTVVEEVREKFPAWTIYTLTSPTERGYYQGNQEKKSKQQIRSEIIRLFAEVELLSEAEYFFGTFSSNVSLYLAWRMPRERCIGVDFNEWKILP